MNTKEYSVMWEIQLDAENPRDAALQALSIMQDPSSIATVFSITDKNGETHAVDLGLEV